MDPTISPATATPATTATDPEPGIPWPAILALGGTALLSCLLTILVALDRMELELYLAIVLPAWGLGQAMAGKRRVQKALPPGRCP